MKRTFIIATAMILTAGATKVNAQLANYTVTTPNLTENSSTADNKSAGVAGVNTMVTESFSKTFPGVANVIWSKSEKTTWGYFKQQGVPVRVSYNQKGRLMYTIKYYGQSQVSEFIQNTLVREGYSMPVVQVTEIKSRYNTINLVRMEDQHSIVTVKIGIAGDVTVYEEFNKG
jgi:hypothetical protein